MNLRDIVRIIQATTLAAIFLLWLWRWLSRRNTAKQASAWPVTEATIETGQFEIVKRTRWADITLPVFGFSFSVRGELYGGRFALYPYITDPGESIVTRMIGRKLQVKYDPNGPEKWLIPEKLIEGCKVEQKFGADLVNYAPKD